MIGTVPLHEAGAITLIAGPCSVEDREQMELVASMIERLGLSWIRGGVYKPRSSPYSFQGLGDEGLVMLREVSTAHGLAGITEACDARQARCVLESMDALQIGARNMTNFSLLREVGKITAETQMPVLFKRGMAATIEEWLLASEYLTVEGNSNVMLCERGIRTFETATRFTLDISAVPVVQQRSLLPIGIDVSHAAGLASFVPSLAKAAIAAGAEALMIEVHPTPATAKSDGPQQLTCEQFEALFHELEPLAAALGKRLV